MFFLGKPDVLKIQFIWEGSAEEGGGGGGGGGGGVGGEGDKKRRLNLFREFVLQLPTILMRI